VSGNTERIISDFFGLPSSMFERIMKMKPEGKSAEDIKSRVSKKSKLSPEMVAYVMTKDIPALIS
jgi:hypothetical protein